MNSCILTSSTILAYSVNSTLLCDILIGILTEVLTTMPLRWIYIQRILIISFFICDVNWHSHLLSAKYSKLYFSTINISLERILFWQYKQKNNIISQMQ